MPLRTVLYLVLVDNLLGHGTNAGPGLRDEGQDLGGGGVESSAASRELHGDGDWELGHTEGIVIAATGGCVQHIGGAAHGVYGAGGGGNGSSTCLGHLIVSTPVCGQFANGETRMS